MNETIVKIAEHLKHLKCKNIAVFDLSEGGGEKFFIVASALNCEATKHVADELAEKINYTGEKDGYHKGEWIILNDSPYIIHIFTVTDRAKYNIDKLYKSRDIDIAKYIKKKKSK